MKDGGRPGRPFFPTRPGTGVTQPSPAIPLPVLFRNDQQAGHHWLWVRLRQDGPNPRAIGATVRLQAGEKTLRRAIMPTRSYQAQVMPEATFGLGESTGPVLIEVSWPDGTTTAHEVRKIDRDIVIGRHGEGPRNRSKN